MFSRRGRAAPGRVDRFERLHVQRISERSFEARSSIASNVSPAARGALALRYMPGMVLRPVFLSFYRRFASQTCAVEEQPSSCGIPKPDVAMREQRLSAHKAISTGLAACRKRC